MSSDALIKATALNRYYGNYQAVNNFNLTLRKGEVLGLLGPNGAGKSTTMQMLTGNISPSSGEIIISGIDLLESPSQAKQSIGYLPELPPVYLDMTVTEFLSYCAALHDVPKSQRKSSINNAIERCGLEPVPDKLIVNLSKGFQQRVGIAQAILHQPEVVILDEPTVGLDPIQIREIRQLISELGKDHGVILSTHILPEVQAVCNRVQIIHQGKTVFADSLEALSDRQNPTKVIVGFENSIDKKQLHSLSNVEHVEELPEGKENRYLLSFSQKPETTAIYQLAQQSNWQLNELTPQIESLEQIFMNLVHSENIADETTQEEVSEVAL